MSFAICFNLDHSKILLSDYGLSVLEVSVSDLLTHLIWNSNILFCVLLLALIFILRCQSIESITPGGDMNKYTFFVE